MEDTGDVNRTELNFKENNAQEELEVHIFDDPQNEVETVEEVEYADTVDSVSGVWKQVKTVQKKLLRIDVSNDPISATQLPILHAVSSNFVFLCRRIKETCMLVENDIMFRPKDRFFRFLSITSAWILVRLV